MTKMLYCTTNPSKLKYMQQLLAELPVEIIGLNDLHLDISLETADALSPVENARRLAHVYLRTSGMPVIYYASGKNKGDNNAICLVFSEGVYFEKELASELCETFDPKTSDTAAVQSFKRFVEQAMTPLYLSPLTETMARDVCKWRYDGLYAVYNLSDWEVIVANSWELSSADAREDYFQAIMYMDALIGFGRIQPTPDGVVIGIGLDPEQCGKGYGRKAMSLLVAEAIQRHPNQRIMLEVRRFNKRAINCYNTIGFKTIASYKKETVNGFVDYDQMTLEFK